MDKVLSIVIAAYNVEDYLERTLESCILPQEMMKMCEVIIVDDGSSDNTYQVAEQYVNKYPMTFRLIRKKNGGYGSVINIGIKEATGKYFKLLDGDDWYDTLALKTFIESLMSTDSDLVLTNYVLVNSMNTDKKFIRYDSITANKKIKFSDIELNDAIGMHGMCYRTDILQKNRISITEHCYYTDTEYVLYPMPYIKTAIYYDIYLYQYMQGIAGQSISVDGIRKHIVDMETLINNLDVFFDSIKEKNNQKFIEYKIAMVYKFYLSSLLLLPCGEEIKRKVIQFDNWVKENHSTRYIYMENRKIKIMRLSGYRLYRLCAEYQQRKNHAKDI